MRICGLQFLFSDASALAVALDSLAVALDSLAVALACLVVRTLVVLPWSKPVASPYYLKCALHVLSPQLRWWFK